MKLGIITALRFVNTNIYIQDDSSGSKRSYGPVLHLSYLNALQASVLVIG